MLSHAPCNAGQEADCSTLTLGAHSLLPPEVREDVEQQLELDLEAIQQRYALFVSSLCRSVIQKGITVQDLCLYLMNLPALECNYDDKKHKLLSGVKAKLQETTTIHGIFTLLSLECASFLNYGVFQSILDDHDIVQNSDALRYSKHLKDYLDMHKISEFLEINPRLEKFTNDASKKLILKFNIALSSRVTRVLDLKRTIAKILRLLPSALQLVGIEEGCLIVTFLIPSFASDFTPEQIREFQALSSVLWLKCGDQEFHFIRLNNSQVNVAGIFLVRDHMHFVK